MAGALISGAEALLWLPPNIGCALRAEVVTGVPNKLVAAEGVPVEPKVGLEGGVWNTEDDAGFT